MIARVARFQGQPDRFTSVHRYRYVLDALAEVPGCRAVYHLTGADDSLSISLWDDESSRQAGEAAVGEARMRLGIEAAPPTHVETFEVASDRMPPPALP